MNLGKKIIKMSEFMDAESIAKAVEIPLEIIEGFIQGEIAEEVLSNYDVTKPAEIRIVEQKTFIRSRTVGVVATNEINRSLVTANMAVRLAKRVNQDVALIDLAELTSQAVYLDLNSKDKVGSLNFLMEANDTFKSKGQPHPLIENLALFLGSTNPINHQNLTEEKMIDIIEDVSSNYGIVLIECPSGIKYLDKILPSLDLIVVVTGQNMVELNKYKHIFGYLESKNLLDRVSVITEGENEPGNLGAQETKRVIKSFGNVNIIGTINYDTSAKKLENIFNKTKYTENIDKILGEIFHDERKDENKKQGLLKQLFGGN